MKERYDLALNRIDKIKDENILPSSVKDFFTAWAEFLLYVSDIYLLSKDEKIKELSLEELKANNKKLYSFYVKAPNKYLSALDAELKAVVLYAYEKDLYNLVIRYELFLEFLSAYYCAAENGLSDPKDEDLRNILYYYVYDYTLDATKSRIHKMFDTKDSFGLNVLLDSDWNDERSLYYYGEYVTDSEIECLKYINSLPYETIKKMADTFTEGYRIGFQVTNKDITKKQIVEIRYHIGFERVVLEAIKNFEAMNLKTVIRRNVRNLLDGRGINRIGIEAKDFDKQYIFDHKDDLALILDKPLNTVKIESTSKAFLENKDEAKKYAGPAVMEVFGEEPFDYQTDNLNAEYTDEQQKLVIKCLQDTGTIIRRYILEEERSFTIIAFPTPDIGKDFEKIFDEVIKLNTLDYMLYRNVQQTIIDTLDKGDYCIVKGNNKNKTNLKVNLYKLKDKEKETIFENCVADVNIPVGEVFTSPVLEGTTGRLHVSKVFLNGLEYKDLSFDIKDGMVSDYNCLNFPSEEANKKYIKDNILHHHESLPVGEFAIGTNTVAYTMARKYNIEDKLPILIAEKTGPHFALGDTCYSNAEEIRIFNPDGKEIVAKDNSCSLKRDTDLANAYFNCHTDITIPYDELGEISVVTKDNEVITIIENGLFVLAGTQILNEALLK